MMKSLISVWSLFCTSSLRMAFVKESLSNYCLLFQTIRFPAQVLSGTFCLFRSHSLFPWCLQSYGKSSVLLGEEGQPSCSALSSEKQGLWEKRRQMGRGLSSLKPNSPPAPAFICSHYVCNAQQQHNGAGASQQHSNKKQGQFCLSVKLPQREWHLMGLPKIINTGQVADLKFSVSCANSNS